MTTQTVVSSLADEARIHDPTFYLDGSRFATYARRRREAPVFRCETETGSFWALSRYEDIAWADTQPNRPLTTTQGLFITEANRLDRVYNSVPVVFTSR